MNFNTFHGFLRIVCVVSAMLPTLAQAQTDTVLEWNSIMQTTVGTAPTNANFQARWGAIVQLAVFEAVNSITGEYEPYLGIPAGPAWASLDAAAATAAHRTLVALRPSSATTLGLALAKTLESIADGPKRAGVLVGETAASAMLARRVNDGAAEAPLVPYTPGNQPGDWQPAPPSFTSAFHPGWGLVTPFGLKDGTQFRLPPPPSLRSGRYAQDYEEVKLLGRVDSALRPLHRTYVASFFASASPVQVWNQAARQASAAKGLSLSENARLFALVAMSMCDASIAAYDSKYHYSFWRPLTAIRAGEFDGNRQTISDTNWMPLITTPAFPGYASAHATLSNAARTVLERTFGKDGLAITLVNPSLPTVILNYDAWEQITDDIDDARVYGGIHFRFEQEFGALQGRHVATYILQNYLRSWDELQGFEN